MKWPRHGSGGHTKEGCNSESESRPAPQKPAFELTPVGCSEFSRDGREEGSPRHKEWHRQRHGGEKADAIFTAENTESVSMKTPQELQHDSRLI